MRINWKVRFKNPTFWALFIPSLIGLVYSVYVLVKNLPAYDETALAGLVGAVTSILGVFGITVDPTTKGISDSKRAMFYTEPNGGEQE